jgi:hypothetical protein
VQVVGFENAAIQFRALQGSGNGGTWVQVVGDESRQGSKLDPRPFGDQRGLDGTVAVFTGATGTASGQYNVSKGGRLLVRGVYHERSSDSLNGLHLTDSGTLSIDATRFSYATSKTAPTVAADNFHGVFTLATCMLMPVETQETCRFELRGDGGRASVLALNNQFWVQKPGTTADTVWRNMTQPRARGGLIGSNINTSNKEASPQGFEFLDNVGDHPDPAKSKFDVGPLKDRGGVDNATIVQHLAPLRSTRPWILATTATDRNELSIHRVIASGGRGTVVEMKAVK